MRCADPCSSARGRLRRRHPLRHLDHPPPLLVEARAINSRRRLGLRRRRLAARSQFANDLIIAHLHSRLEAYSGLPYLLCPRIYGQIAVTGATSFIGPRARQALNPPPVRCNLLNLFYFDAGRNPFARRNACKWPPGHSTLTQTRKIRRRKSAICNRHKPLDLCRNSDYTRENELDVSKQNFCPPHTTPR